MRIYLFDIGEEAVINRNALYGIPDRIGSIAEVIEHLDCGSYDYKVRFIDGSCVNVKEDELTRLDKDDPILTIQLGDTYINVWGEVGKVKLIDYFYGQLEIEYLDSTFEVLPVERFLDSRERVM